jgi:beta-lactamase regulating signal transducer with metallopeptidase domain
MDHLLDEGFAGGLVGATLRATVLLFVAWVAAWGLRRSSAAVRHRVWSLALLGLIVLPAAMRIGPAWRVPILPGAPPSAEPAPSIAPSAMPATASPPVAAIEVPRVVSVAHAPRPPLVAEVPGIVASRRTSRIAPGPVLVPRAPAAVASPWSTSDVVTAAWAAGFVASLLPTLAGVVVGEVCRRRARAINGDRWAALLDTVRETYAIRRRVELRSGGDSPIPVTWGVVRPVVLIPEESEDWPESTRRLVLMHELAHVGRLDVMWLMLGRLAAALFWFHPLAWHALRRLRDECERACDDCVVAAGEQPTVYARQLLDLARSLRMPRFAVAVPMARTNLLEGRMMAMFDTHRSHAPLGRRSGRLLVALAALAILVIAAIRPGPAAARAEALPSPTAPEGPGRIAGVAVRDSDKTPVAGAEVVLLPPPPKGQDAYYGKLPLRKVVADAKGAFAFEGLAPGKYRVWANSGALTSRLKQLNRGGADILVPENGDGPKPVELRLVAAPTITARIQDKATGKPIPGATVQTGWSDFPDDFKADARGVALVRPLTTERYLLEAWADGHAKMSRWVNLESGEDAEEAFALEPGGDLKGLVSDPDGKPLAGVGLGFRLKGVGAQHDYVETDATGRYRIAHLPRGATLTVSGSRRDYSSKDVDIMLSQASGRLDLTLEPMPDGGSIVGIVRDHRGAPIAGAELVNQGRSTAQNRETKTGADGRFRLDNLFEGSTGKEVLVRAKGQAPKRVKVEPGPRDQPAEVTIDLEAGHTIKGRVVDEKGKPIAGVMVDFAHGRNAFSDGGRMDTDAQGRFAFDSLPEDSPFGFSKDGFSAIQDRRLELDGDEEVVVEMTSAGVILGRAVDAKTGKPIKNFVVQITFSPKRQPGDPSGGLASDLVSPGQSFQSAEGLFKLNNLIVDMPLQVTVSAEGYEKQVADLVRAAHPADAQDEELRLEPIDPATLQVIRGRMVDSEGKAIAGAQLRLIVAGPRDPGPRHGFPFNWTMITTGQIAQQGRVRRFLATTTDAKGQFLFERVPRGLEIELVWWGKGVAAGRADHLEALEREDDELLEVITQAPARVVGAIDRKLHPEAGRIRVANELGAIDYDDLELKPGQVDYEFGDLRPGTYLVSLESTYERVPGSNGGLTSRTLASDKVTIEPGETARVDFKK